MPWIKFHRTDEGDYEATVVGEGESFTVRVDDIYVDSGSPVAFSKYGGQLVTRNACRVVEVETVPGVVERVLACTRKAISELRETLKYV